MEQRLSLVTLGVDDLARSRRFYEGLRWSPGFADESVVFFELGGIVLALWSLEELAADANVAPAAAGPVRVALAHNVRAREEVDTVLAEAAAAGATIVRPAAEQPWGGYTAYFTDPDGHAWEVAWNPAWPIDAEGRVSLS